MLHVYPIRVFEIIDQNKEEKSKRALQALTNDSTTDKRYLLSALLVVTFSLRVVFYPHRMSCEYSDFFPLDKFRSKYFRFFSVAAHWPN